MVIFGNCAPVDPRLVGLWKKREEEQSLINKLLIVFLEEEAANMPTRSRNFGDKRMEWL
jgi:hypothetical protein